MLDLSVVIVSFNTRDLLRECLNSFFQEVGSISHEVIVVDNASKDGSADMVESEFPSVKLVRSSVNLGFAAANNRAFPLASGKYILLLNSDAFLRPGALQKALQYMEQEPNIGLGGARLVGSDDSWQPSARMFPSLLNELLMLTGLAAKYSKSKFFGRADRTWADQNQRAEVDWVPGAFAIIRRNILEEVGYFDEKFFLYYEEVDLCRRIKKAGYNVCYWPDVVVVHLGGESSKTVKHLSISSSGSQLTLWRMRSELLYYSKHHGTVVAWLAMQIEVLWHWLRLRKNHSGNSQEALAKKVYSEAIIVLMKKAWKETNGGRISPTTPW